MAPDLYMEPSTPEGWHPLAVALRQAVSHGPYVDGPGVAMSFSGCDNKVLQMQLILLPRVFLCLVEAGRFFASA
jgi:hypothetical protein